MTPIYLNNWSDKPDMLRSFACYGDRDNEKYFDQFDHVEVLLASYGYENYSGDAFVLYRDIRDGRLYEVHGSHCSCYGLEGQWEPELSDLESLRFRAVEGTLGNDSYSGNVFNEELRALLEVLK